MLSPWYLCQVTRDMWIYIRMWSGHTNKKVSTEYKVSILSNLRPHLTAHTFLFSILLQPIFIPFLWKLKAKNQRKNWEGKSLMSRRRMKMKTSKSPRASCWEIITTTVSLLLSFLLREYKEFLVMRLILLSVVDTQAR